MQLISGSDSRRNVHAALRLVREAASQGAEYIQLPEYFNYLGPVSGYEEVSESIPGPTTTLLGDVAAELGVTVHLGSMLERSALPGRYFNTSVVLGRAGEIIRTYRKVHLFDIDVPDGVTYRESDAISPGNELVVADVAGVKIGMSICFDLRFPEFYRQLALNGADVMAIPAAFNAVTGRAHWEILVRARAIENHAFVVAAAHAGTTDEGIATYGHSMIVGPWGEVVAESVEDGEDLLVATLDLTSVTTRRAQIDVLHLRRSDLYG